MQQRFTIKVLAFVTLVSGFAINCNTSDQSEKDESHSSTFSPGVNDVSIKIINSQEFNIELVANGKVSSHNIALLNFITSGVISTLPIKNGMHVRKGDIIATIENKKQKLAIEQCQNQVTDALINYRALLAQYGYSDKDSLTIPSNVKSFVAMSSELEKAKTNLKLAQYDYDCTIIKAPIDGLISDLTVKIFNPVTTSDMICRIIDDKAFEVEASFLELEVSQIQLGDNAIIISLDNNSDSVIGKLIEVNPSVSSQGLVKVKFQLSNVSSHLFLGQNVKIIVHRNLNSIISVPKNAVVDRDGKKVAFTIKDHKALWNYVQIEGENGTDVAIKSGLSIGDSLIIEGNTNLVNDALVRIINVVK